LIYKFLVSCQDLTDFSLQTTKDHLCTLSTVEDGNLKFYNLPYLQTQLTYNLQPIHTLSLGDKIRFHLLRWYPYGAQNLLAVTDLLSNIFIFKGGKLSKTYLNAHAKLITDLCWFFTWNEDTSTPTPLFVTTSMDGSMKIWSLEDQTVPIYEYYTSKVRISLIKHIEMDILSALGCIHECFVFQC
jgi:WD40 repeat protein